MEKAATPRSEAATEAGDKGWTFPDPDEFPEADVLIYDRDCGFCQSSIRKVSWLDRKGRLAFMASRDPRREERYPNLSQERLDREMVIVCGNGKQFGGGDGLIYLTRRLPALWIFAPFCHFPGTKSFWRWSYRVVARNRHKLGPTEGPTCGVPSSEPGKDESSQL